MKEYVKNWIEEHRIDNEQTIDSLVSINMSIEKIVMAELEDKIKAKTLEIFGKQPIF